MPQNIDFVTRCAFGYSGTRINLYPEISRALVIPRFRGRKLSKELTELAQLDKAGVRIIFEIAFRKSAEAHELRIVDRITGRLGRGRQP